MDLLRRFGKSKKKSRGEIFPAFVLLSEATLDIEDLARRIYDDWGIEFAAEDIREGTDGESPMLVSMDIEGCTVAISLMAAPVPNDEAVQNAYTNWWWEDAVEVAQNHQAHILLAVLGPDDKPLKNIATLQAKLGATCLKLPQAQAMNALGTVVEPSYYISGIEIALEEDIFPILNYVFFGMYSKDEGKTFSGYTFGLETLGKQDIEILNSTQGFDETLGFMRDIASYLMDYDAVIKDGETVGFTEEQKLPVTKSKGVAIPGRTLKIAF